MKFSSAGATVELRTEFTGLEKEIQRNLGKHVPLDDATDDVAVDYEVKISEGKPSIERNRDRLLYTGTPNRSLYVQDIISVLSRVFEGIYIRQGKLSMHSSLIGKDEKGILLPGFPNAGKTSLAVNLCNKENFSYGSGDRTVLDKNGNVLAGTQSIQLPAKVLHQEFNVKKYEKSSWEEKLQFEPEELNIKRMTFPENLRAAIFPYLNRADTQVRRIDRPDKTFKLYQQSTYFDSMYLPVLYGMNRPVPDFIGEEGRKKKLNILESATENVGCYKMSGSLEDLTMSVEEQVNGYRL